jgi:glycosyltransferase involved in cell wall biosynthesis
MFSILICTRNSSRVISEVIESLVSQSRLDLINEVIIVDYLSTDNTINIINKQLEGKKLKLIVKIIDSPGKSNALIHGLNIANSKYTLILDDDNILEHNFVKNASNILSSNTMIGCLGSFGIVDPAKTYPTWFEEYKSSFAIGLPQQGRIKDWVWGAASIIKMEAWRVLQNNNFRFLLEVERLAHNIPVKIGGEDVELSLAIKKIGYEIDFSETLKFIHKFDTTRLNDSYLISNNKGVAASVTIHEIYRAFIYNTKYIKYGQIIFHYRIHRKILISFLVLVKNLFKNNIFNIKMSYSTFIGIINGYFYFFSKIKNYSFLIKKLEINNGYDV